MDRRISELIDVTQGKFGLDNYYLKGHELNRYVNVFQETVYTLSMEWFPEHVEEPKDGSNPVGTAIIEVNVSTHQFISVIFVMDTTYAMNGISFASMDKYDIIEWMERETGLIYGKQLQLHKEEEGTLLFNEVFNGVSVSPSGSVEIKYDSEGNLTLFSVQGQFPSKDIIKKETYTLNFNKVEHLLKEQLQLIEFPSHEEKIISIYGVEEVYITNDQMRKFPFEFIVDVKFYTSINQKVFYDKKINNLFKEEEINLMEEVTADQALSLETSPEAFPITKEEQEKCLLAVKDFLLQKYPEDSGVWTLKTLHRERNYIHAILRLDKQDYFVFQRKLTVIIDASNYKAINYVDNKIMLEMFERFQAPGVVKIDQEEAYEKLKGLYELQPYYVYDFDQKKYILCGKLDCPYGVNATNGEVIALNDL